MSEEVYIRDRWRRLSLALACAMEDWRTGRPVNCDARLSEAFGMIGLNADNNSGGFARGDWPRAQELAVAVARAIDELDWMERESRKAARQHKARIMRLVRGA